MEYQNSFCGTVKSVKVADSYRKKGNGLYKQGLFHAALVEYNKSICCAPSKSKELGLAYANRSAIYFEVQMYRKCIDNISMARGSCYPHDKIKTLDDREEKCRQQLKTGLPDENFDVWDFFKLSYKSNKKIPFIIDGLELDEDKKHGRMIVTTRDLKAGNVIAIEEPCFMVLDDIALKYRCSFCLKNNHYSLIPCEKCPKVMYCSKSCRDKDHHCHKTECLNAAIDSQPLMLEKMISGALRILGTESALMGLLEKQDIKTVFDFDLSNPKAPDYEKIILKTVNMLSKSARISSETKSGELYQRLLHHFRNISNNNSYQYAEYSYEKHADGKSYFDFAKAMGGGIFPFASLLNHSCYPNVAQVIVEGKLVFVVARPVKSGEQILVSYGPKFTTDHKFMRKARLDKYGFDCHCVACANDYPRITDLPRSDRKFVAPNLLTATQNVISQFRDNCKYINKNSRLPVSFEVALLNDQNSILLTIIARRTLNDSEIEYADFTPKINLSN